MLQVLTFLGINDYTPTAYTWKGKQVKTPTPYVAEAFCELYQLLNPGSKINKVIVFLTPQAREKHWEKLQECFQNSIELKDVSIPSGNSEAEVWQIFDAVVSAVDANSQVLFDITNAFRSIPILVLLASSFLQKARNVEIKGVYYGAYEVNKQAPPIFDLTPAIKLLDWLAATQQFVTTGSSVELGRLLKTIQQDFKSINQPNSTPPRLLEKLGTSIQDISRSLELIRSVGILKDTAELQKIPANELAKEVGLFAKPFELISEQIQQSYSQFALANPEQSQNSKSALQKQFLLIRWYVKNNMGTQAILLAREWVISAQCLNQGYNDYLSQSNREKIEDEINLMKKNRYNLTPATARSKEDKLIILWSDLIKYRNDIAHTEMRRNSADITKLQNYVKNQLIKNLENLFSEFSA